MSVWSYLWRLTRRYLFCPESFIALVLLVVIYNTFMNITPLWQKAKEKLRLPVSVTNFQNFKFQNSRSQPRSSGLYWPSDPNKLSWESKSGNVAAYSIQGRRPHMEDRFKIHNNGNKLGLYGIFDGHGGDVSATLMSINVHIQILLV